MQLRISDAFISSLTKLTNDEQKAVKVTALDLQLNPANPGLSFHKLDKAKDKNFWSVRVNLDIRIIVHRTEESLLLCYVDHHDDAYAWAEKRKIETHPKTGAAQLVEIRERVQEIVVPVYTQEEVQAPAAQLDPVFDGVSDDDLLGYGVPEEWLDDVKAATEETILEIADHLPGEAAEALLNLATGTKPEALAQTTGTDPFAHPDAQRRFRVLTNKEELEQALEYPWEKWSVFLHPAQRSLVEREYNGPARISGSAGTGKTIVALHRAAHLARRNPDARVLLTTFSKPLAYALRLKLGYLVGNQPNVSERIEVQHVDGIAYDLYSKAFEQPNLATEKTIRSLISKAAGEVEEHKFTDQFCWNEWRDVVDAWQLRTWEDYRDVQRLGRRTRLGEKQRAILWAIYKKVRAELDAKNLVTWPDIYGRVSESASGNVADFDYVIVDEAQDVAVHQLRLLAKLGETGDEGLFFTGDLGQRIFQTPYSWKSLGVDVRGRSHTLRINYRTSHQIRGCADKLLPSEIADVDGNKEGRKGTISVFNGPKPEICIPEGIDAECDAVSDWISARLNEGMRPSELGVFVREHEQRARAQAAVKAAGAKAIELGEKFEHPEDCIAIATMHLAKGLEFRAACVMACDDDVLPLRERIESVSDESDLQEVYNTERHLLYVACTRARESLLVTGVAPASEFLEDLEAQ